MYNLAICTIWGIYSFNYLYLENALATVELITGRSTRKKLIAFCLSRVEVNSSMVQETQLMRHFKLGDYSQSKLFYSSTTSISL